MCVRKIYSILGRFDLYMMHHVNSEGKNRIIRISIQKESGTIYGRIHNIDMKINIKWMEYKDIIN